MYFRKNFPWQILGFNNFLIFPLLLQINDLIFSTQIFVIKWKPVKPDVLQWWKSRVWLHGRAETIFKKAPRDKRLVWLGVNPDLSRLQKNAFQRNQFTWLHDVIGPEASNNWKFLPIACWKSAFILHVIGVHQSTQSKWTWKMSTVEDPMDLFPTRWRFCLYFGIWMNVMHSWQWVHEYLFG